ncbi:MAG TPA: galactosyldiacylglycerol synthase [Dehalococcoidia bacterium]|nr:galactosyldiacylglycerol synthase [Dehalococcoidia bacterium]
MILLYSQVGELSEEQLDFLVDNLEEEWPEDRDYYINRPMLDLLKQRGADATLVHLLTQALGDREEVDILWIDTDELEEMDAEEDGF